tara:strand:- start:410 stop:1099 length:690 start_codon:yes stop_codon:yes gene_type:complete
MSNTKWEDGLEAVENSRYDQYGFSDLNEFEGINNGMRVLQSGEETLKIEDKTKDRTSPNEDLVKLLDRRSKFTPDMRELKQMPDLQLVFVYGTLKKGHGNHYLLENSVFLGEGHTRGYYCWLKRKGFPVVMERVMGMSSEYSGKIKGEVYAVDLSTLAALDQLEANGTMYNRKKVQVNLRDQLVEAEHNPKFTGRPFKPCYMYVGDDTYWRGSEYDEHVTIENGPMHKW